uniref:Lipase n=1 Tax=Graphocephala atropunctata TaxID=36148 RepID=A0A1B6M7U3_9HEMI
MVSVCASSLLAALALVAASLSVRTIAARGDCQSTLCFNIFSRSVKLDINLFDDAVPLPIEEYVGKLGYPIEHHDITTEDGYILRYHRIRHGKLGPPTSLGPPVLLQHGLLGASSAWLLSNYSLGYSLADAGFDVWLGNSRGNTYSRRHVKYDPDKDEQYFWDFSWHEMGYYDLPASIDYILNVTGHSQLFYIGHSMGTTMYFVLGATRPEYMDKVQAMVAMAPVAFPWNIRSSLTNFLHRLHMILNGMARILDISEVFPHSDTMSWIDRNICAKKRFKFICKDMMYYIGGFEEKDLNRTAMLTVLQYMPAGSSFKQLSHFRQIADKGSDFNKFDYGYFGNMWKYRSFYPPTYNLQNVNTSIYVYYGMNDWLSVPEDVHHVVDHLPNVQRVTQVPDDQFNHLDFMWAVDAKTLIYNDIISTLYNLTTTY